MRTPGWMGILLLAAGVQFGCGNSPTGPDDRLPRELTVMEKKLIETDTQFGFRLFRFINQQERDKNLFISPLSISMALGMTLNGANGNTYTAMKNTLGFTGMSDEEINQGYRSLMDLLLNLDSRVIIDIANAIFYHQQFQVLPQFLDVNRTYFSAEIRALNFFDPTSVDVINGWVENKTRGKIKKIIDQIDPDNVMFLLNAIYFKGVWTYLFKEDETHDDPFYLPDGTTKTVKMMIQTARLPYFADEEVQIVDLPYGRGVFRMTLVLPRENVSLDTLIGNLTAAKWLNWMQQLKEDTVTVEFPKFTFQYNIVLNKTLQTMGMAVAFDPNKADFTRMHRPVSGQRVYISLVKHKSFVEVNEEGTEAAAVTVVVVSVTTVGPKTKRYFKADRPFLFVIREKNSNAILFMGKMVNP